MTHPPQLIKPLLFLLSEHCVSEELAILTLGLTMTHWCRCRRPQCMATSPTPTPVSPVPENTVALTGGEDLRDGAAAAHERFTRKSWLPSRACGEDTELGDTACSCQCFLSGAAQVLGVGQGQAELTVGRARVLAGNKTHPGRTWSPFFDIWISCWTVTRFSGSGHQRPEACEDS